MEVTFPCKLTALQLLGREIGPCEMLLAGKPAWGYISSRLSLLFFVFSLFTWYGQVADSNLHITKQSSSSSNPENWNTAKMSLNIAYIVDNNSSQMLFVAFEILHVLWICQFSGSYSTLNLQPSSVSRTLTPSFLNVFLYFSFFFPPLLTYLNHLKPLVVYWASSTQKRYND